MVDVGLIVEGLVDLLGDKQPLESLVAPFVVALESPVVPFEHALESLVVQFGDALESLVVQFVDALGSLVVPFVDASPVDAGCGMLKFFSRK